MSCISLCWKEDLKGEEVQVRPGIKDRGCLAYIHRHPLTSTHKHSCILTLTQTDQSNISPFSMIFTAIYTGIFAKSSYSNSTTRLTVELVELLHPNDPNKNRALTKLSICDYSFVTIKTSISNKVSFCIGALTSVASMGHGVGEHTVKNITCKWDKE